MTQTPPFTDKASAVSPQEEAALNDLLDCATALKASDALKASINAQFDAEFAKDAARPIAQINIGEFFQRFWLASTGALAGVSALGLAAGIVTASSSVALAPEEEMYLYAEDSFALASLDEEEIGEWAVE